MPGVRVALKIETLTLGENSDSGGSYSYSKNAAGGLGSQLQL